MRRLSPLPESDREAIREILARRSPALVKSLDLDGALDQGQYARIQQLLLNEFMDSLVGDYQTTEYSLAVEKLMDVLPAHKRALLPESD